MNSTPQATPQTASGRRRDQALSLNMRLLAHHELEGFGGIGEGMAMQLARDGRRILWLAHESAPKNFTGVDSPYEVPEHAELRIDTTQLTPEQAAERVLEQLQRCEIAGPA